MIGKHVFSAVAITGSLLLAGCGDAGDHFGEFARTGSRVVPVVRVTLSVPKFKGAPGTYPIQVVAFEAAGNPVPAGQSYTHPIVLSTAGQCAGKLSKVPGNGSGDTVSIPNTTTQAFITLSCSPSKLIASDVDMPKQVELSL